MKIFNKGARLFRFHGIEIKPDVFTTIPPEREEAAKKMLADYPNELVTGDEAHPDVKAASATIDVLRKENATLKGQVDKLQKLLLASESDDVAQLQKKLEAAQAEIADLKGKLSGTATAAETPASPAAETDSAEAPAPAPKAAKKARNLI